MSLKSLEVASPCSFFAPCSRRWPPYSGRVRILASIFLIAIATAPHAAFAQVSVEIVLPQDKFLPAEELLVGVRVANQSGQTLNLGDEPDWIQFTVQREGGGFVSKMSNPPVKRSFKLESTERATLSVDLAPCYDLREVGRYLISAEVRIKNWGETLATKRVPFEIIEGTKLWEQVVGIPDTTSNQPPRTRIYSLQQANYLAEPRLYLRVSESDGEVVKLITVGRMLSFGRPQPLVDKKSQLHLLQQNGARTSQYLVINPDGKIQVRHLYEYTDSRPRLRLDENGEVLVSGGTRRESPEDLPVEAEPQNDDAKLKQQ